MACLTRGLSPLLVSVGSPPPHVGGDDEGLGRDGARPSGGDTHFIASKEPIASKGFLIPADEEERKERPQVRHKGLKTLVSMDFHPGLGMTKNTTISRFILPAKEGIPLNHTLPKDCSVSRPIKFLRDKEMMRVDIVVFTY